MLADISYEKGRVTGGLSSYIYLGDNSVTTLQKQGIYVYILIGEFWVFLNGRSTNCLVRRCRVGASPRAQTHFFDSCISHYERTVAPGLPKGVACISMMYIGLLHMYAKCMRGRARFNGRDRGVEEGRETLPTGRASSPDLRLETGKTGKGVRANIRERNAT